MDNNRINVGLVLKIEGLSSKINKIFQTAIISKDKKRVQIGENIIVWSEPLWKIENPKEFIEKYGVTPHSLSLSSTETAEEIAQKLAKLIAISELTAMQLTNAFGNAFAADITTAKPSHGLHRSVSSLRNDGLA